MDDIEDLVNGMNGLNHHSPITSVVPPAPSPGGLNDDENSRIQPVKVHEKATTTSKKEEDVGENVPGVAKIWSKTFGCSHNVSDGEYMEGALASYGYKLVEEKDQADLWLINSCTVKDPSQSAFIHLVDKAKEEGKGLVVAGCVPQADRSLGPLEDVSMVGVTQIDQIVNVVEQTLQGNTVKLLAKKTLPQLNLPKVRKNKLIEIIPLSTGCLGSCTYCKTKHARGKLGSYDPDSIVNRVEQVLCPSEEELKLNKCKPSEIWLASEDTGAYGRDLGTDIASLLLRLTNKLETKGDENTMLRLGMTNPPFILGLLDRIAEALRHPNMFKFLHIPVQSGNNKVLTDMNREYTVEEFQMVADYMIKNVPGITIATDIICGFPGETEEEFEDTLELVKEYKFPVVNISQFYPRPGTPAAKMKRVPTQIVKNRSRKLSALFETYKPYEHLLGKTIPCWVSEEISKDETQSIAHTEAYIKVTISPRIDDMIGKKVIVKIEETHKFHVVGKIVSPN